MTFLPLISEKLCLSLERHKVLRVWHWKAFVCVLKSTCIHMFGTLSPAYTVARIYTCRPYRARCSHTKREDLQRYLWNQEDRGLPVTVLNAGNRLCRVLKICLNRIWKTGKNITFVNITFVLNSLWFSAGLILGREEEGEGVKRLINTLKMNERINN